MKVFFFKLNIFPWDVEVIEVQLTRNFQSVEYLLYSVSVSLTQDSKGQILPNTFYNKFEDISLKMKGCNSLFIHAKSIQSDQIPNKAFFTLLLLFPHTIITGECAVYIEKW